MKGLSIFAMLLGLLLIGPVYGHDTVYYYSSDTVDSEVVITDASRNVVEQTHYAPYGQVLNRTLRDGPGYTGHEEDPETSLVYMQQRYYDAESGRFVSADPVATTDAGGSFNRYAYVGNNPLSRTDPSGTETVGADWLQQTEAASTAPADVGAFADALDYADANFFTPLAPLGGEFEHLAEVPLVTGLRALAKAGEKAEITVRAEQGAAREAKIAKALKAENPGAKIQNQQYLRDATGKIAKDPLTGQGRRVDHAVIEGGQASTVETTSLGADKAAQAAKEQRILSNGGTFVRDRDTRELVPVKGQCQLRRCDP